MQSPWKERDCESERLSNNFVKEYHVVEHLFYEYSNARKNVRNAFSVTKSAIVLKVIVLSLQRSFDN